MKLEDIAKITIDEVAAELEKIQKLEDMQKAKVEEQVRKEPFFISEDEPKEQMTLSKQSIQNTQDFDSKISSEIIFLQNLKERISVLFDGLNSTESTNLDLRLDITIKFLEFLLANVENRLKLISK
ncbi:hypothetical protein CHL9426_00520 [Campylobacter hyointestinalis subsp. lawsonii]|uniref:Campylobacter invasion antigen D C-terminal domain-containing protein n=1 Tax=Campylobacter hyointestinalis TaxID=198 RepID=A0A562XCZ5_CAMHY|nr:hypothetical protein CHL_0981 [Campylobacter hyointestinalis subsp. lawsonii CCUG 27631]RAZ26590.1 hypothetical protein CHL9752_00345 [Campylobacter hyointestinalis subsp. lawsonii]TWO19875.1 hypothetical protein YZ82_07250 [Campylobacter hyointestinalis]RAZ40468.1 hypothetical protein CHL9426_00520 [Campylobacter hyointestinalis subsp. lawsonii]RAZ48827.1 hypothetical protein CHL14416_00880 [Campylobacter hyointestinalis subsp. lawsonii]